MSASGSDYVVDARRKDSDMHIVFNTEKQVPGDTNAVSTFIAPDVVCKVTGVGHPALLKGASFTIGKCHRGGIDPRDDHTIFGVTVCDKNGDPLPTTTQAAIVDAKTGGTHAYHAIDFPSPGFGDTHIPIAQNDGPDDAAVYKAISRWRKEDPAPGDQIDLMKAEDVDAGVSQLTLTGDSKEHDPKYHVPAGCGIHNLIKNAHNDGKVTLAEQYSKENAISEIINGKPGFIVDAKHFHDANASLKRELGSLSGDTTNIGEHGFRVTAELCNSADTPRFISVPVRIHRELRGAPAGITHNNAITLAELDNAMSQAQTKTDGVSLEKAVFKVDDGKNLKATIVPYTPPDALA